MTMKRIAALALAALLALLAAGAMAATTPTVVTDAGENSYSYDKDTKRLTIKKPGEYTIKDWYGDTPGDPAEGQIYIYGDDDEFVLNLENVCLTNIKDNNGVPMETITNYIVGDTAYPPAEQHLTVNFDGNSSLQNNSNYSSCIYVYANNNGIVKLGGTKPTLSGPGSAVYVSTVDVGTVGIEVLGDGAVLESNDCTLAAYPGGTGSTAYVTVSGKNAEITSTKYEAINCAATDSTVEVEISGEGAVITGVRKGILAKDFGSSDKGSIVISAAAEISATNGPAVDTGSLTVKGCALYASEDYAQLLGDSGELITEAAGKTYLRTAQPKTPKVYKNGVEQTGLYDSSLKRLTIFYPGTYTIKDWYGPTPGVPAVGEIYIEESLSGDVVLNLENVCLTGDDKSLITNELASDVPNPPQKLHLTVNFDGKSSLKKGTSSGNCIYICSENDSKVTLGGAKPTISASDGYAVDVCTMDQGAASIAVEGDDADLSSSSGAALRAHAFDTRSTANVTVSGKNAKITSTEGAAILCQGEAVAEVEISGDGAQIKGGFLGILAKDSMDSSKGRIVLSAAAEISSTGVFAVDTGSLTVEGCALYASEDDSDLLGDASSGDLITAAQGKKYLRTVCVHPGGEPQPEDAAASLPKTGDSSSLALWAGLLALSALALSRARRRA